MNEPINLAELDSKDVQRRFDRAAERFDTADFAHTYAREGLFSRLAPMQLAPELIVDLGSATGASAALLAKRFRRSRVLAVDLSQAMLRRVESRRGWLSKIRSVQADATALPLPDHSASLVFSNLLLPWIANPDRVFSELSRVLQKDSLFLFSTLGPDTLRSLGEAFSIAGSAPRINAFADMHDIGDGLVRAGLRDPVLDVDRLTINYSSARALFDDLSATGARNSLRHRRTGLMGRGTYDEAVRRLGEDFSIELEIIYGHAWGSGQGKDGVRIDAGRIPIRRR